MAIFKRWELSDCEEMTISKIIGGTFGFTSSISLSYFPLNCLRFGPVLPSPMISSTIILGLSDLGQCVKPIFNYILLLKLICIMIESC